VRVRPVAAARPAFEIFLAIAADPLRFLIAAFVKELAPSPSEASVGLATDNRRTYDQAGRFMTQKHMGLHAGAGRDERAGQGQGAGRDRRAVRVEGMDRSFALAPLARAAALMVAVGGTLAATQAQAQTAFSPAWFASKGAVQNSAAQTGRLPNGKPATGVAAAQQQSDAARQQLQRSIANLGLSAQAIAAEQARQAAARAAAGVTAPTVPDGLGKGGLAVDTNSLTAGWLGAKAPTQTVNAGQTTVNIEQTQSRAILNWETFNVGRNTTVQFQQQADWAVLNKVNDPSARPSQIQGQIKGDGTVLIVNRNGIVFTGTSQINTRNLVAAAATITDDQFRKNGLYSTGSTPTFSDALGTVEVQAGARIATAKPGSSTQGGGYAMLVGAQVRNDGQIDTPSGQTVLAAGDAVVIRKGAGTDGNAGSTTVGNEVATTRKAGSLAGSVINTGLITAATGDITLTGHDITQGGVVVATTSTAKRGTVHLSTRASDDTGTVTLAKGSTTAILLETASPTALDSQRDAALKAIGSTAGNNASGVFDNLSTIVDRRDLSRVEIVSGGTVAFEGNSLTLATGGEIAVQAVKRTLVDKGAELDVSGAVGVKVAMETNNLKLNAQGNEQRDAPVNRDDKSLNSLDLWIDRRKLVLVPAGTNGYTTDRWYTAGGLLEVSGYLATSGHGVGEWMAQGGTVTLAGGDVVTRAGSRVNLSGGTLDVAGGVVRQSWLKGADGHLYEVSSAPGDLLYKGLFQGYSGEHARWGASAQETFYNPLIAPQERLENGYTVGRDAGKLVIASRSAVLEGTIVGDTYQGPQQTKAPQAGVDGYYQSQDAAARGAQLIVGAYRPMYDAASSTVKYRLDAVVDSVALTPTAPALADGVKLGDAVAADRQGVITLGTDSLNAAGLGGVLIAAKSDIGVKGALQVADGGAITLYAPSVDVAAGLTAHGGTIRVGNVLRQSQGSSAGVLTGDEWLTAPGGAKTGVTLQGGAKLDASGRYTDLRAADGDARLMAWLDGGTVSIRSTDSVTLRKGSTIDVSSGAAVQGDGSTAGGKGGTVQVGAGIVFQNLTNRGAVLTMDATIKGHGVKGGGTLDIESASGIVIGGQAVSKRGVLAAGETSFVDLLLQEDYQVKAGDVLPVDYVSKSYVALPGQRLAGGSLATDVWYVLADDWTLPTPAIGSVNGVQADDGRQWVMFNHSAPGSMVIPKGTRVHIYTFGGSGGFAGYAVEKKVFPDGMRLREPKDVVTPAGQIAPTDFTVAAGSRLPAGASLTRSVSVGDSTSLATDLFSSGFSAYNVRGRLGLAVPDGVTLDVTMPVLRADRSALPVGADPAAGFAPWLPELYQENAVRGVLTQRKGASVSLAAGVADTVFSRLPDAERLTGRVIVGDDATVRVDPGQSISLSGREGLDVEGRLQARGGTVSLLGPRNFEATARRTDDLLGDPRASQRAITLGEQAVVDVSGTAAVATDAQGRRHGLVRDGGAIVIGGTLEEPKGRALSSDAFVVVREGALLDASGASAELDLPGVGRRTVASDGGSIQLASSNGIYLDGTVRARAGGGGASGGQLQLVLEALPYLTKGVDPEVLNLRDLVISQQRGATLAEGEALRYGHGALGVDQVRDGGFSSLTAYSNGAVSFAGDVKLSLDRELRLYSTALSSGTAAGTGRQVHLAAPYVMLSGVGDLGGPDQYTRPSYQGGNTTLASSATLTVEGSLIDLKGAVTLGLNAVVGDVKLDRAGFGQLNLLSQGDLRFIPDGGKPDGNANFDVELASTGSILMRAAQVYPSSGVIAKVTAGRRDGDFFVPGTRLVIERIDAGAVPPAIPSEAFGLLTLDGERIEQNGVVRAPMGRLQLGSLHTDSLTFGAGSLTSVSAAGLVMPYGGTADGVNYLINGKAAALAGVGNGPNLTLTGRSIEVGQGAVLDLSGGGDLRGAGFVSGRGGSTDARVSPLVQVGRDGFTLPGLATNPVYAIVPGYASSYAPTDKGGAVAPRIGQQIALRAGDVPGLPAGTYTLLPSNYALLPGAFRVELNGAAPAQSPDHAIAMRNGSYAVAGTLAVANTGLRDAMPTQVIVTPAEVLRRYSQYNETSYADFVRQQAALNGTVRALLPADAKDLALQLVPGAGIGLRFDGTALFSAAKDGYGGTASLGVKGGGTSSTIDVLGDSESGTPGASGVSVRARDLNALGAARIVVGGTLGSSYGVRPSGSNESGFLDLTASVGAVALRDGALLRAPEVFLLANGLDGGITIESGAGINTIGAGTTGIDSTNGYVYRPGATAVVGASNGQLQILAPQPDNAFSGSGPIRIGVAGDSVSSTTAQLYSEGTLVAATRSDFQLNDGVRYGTRNLTLAVGAVNAGSAEDLAAAQTRGALTPGLMLNQAVLDRLLKGDAASGAPALERLTLTAAESINLFGDVNLSTIDPATGKSRLANLVLSTPALYGHGDAGDMATIATGRLTWVGGAGDAPPPIVGGRGTGSGALQIKADVIEFGYGPQAQPNNIDDFGRTLLGFADVRMTATDRITANHKGSLSVYQSQSPGTGAKPTYTGGNLTLTAPLVTGQGASVNRITAGGDLQLLAPTGGPVTSVPKDVQTGAELDLQGASVRIDTVVALPSGKLVVKSDGDIVLTERSRLDLAGRAIAMQDVTRYSWGGDVTLQSAHGNVTQAAGSVIDLSATNNAAGLLSVIALDADAGRVDLDGKLLASASGRYDAGGTLVPYRAGGLDLRAQSLGDGAAGSTLTGEFATLNKTLNAGGFLGERSFQLKQGDLTIGDELKAREINVSLDGGKLTVTGKVDASGEQVGAIRLAAAGGLTVAGTASLDAHGTVLRVDSRGQIIDSPNRAMVTLDAGTGALTLGDGARIDLRHGSASTGGDGVARGTLDLYAARVGSTGSVHDTDAATFGDIAIDARGRIDVQGAKAIAVYGRQVYTDAPFGTDPAASGRPYQVVDQAYLDARHAESTRFVDGALANGDLLNTKLAGLNNATYRDVLHLRPAVEIDSATPDGDLVVRGDLDLSGQRYASLNPRTPRTAVYGSGEVGMLTLRAGGDLSIYGSINDGFAPPPETPDDQGWILTPGVQRFGGDVIVPIAGVTLADGTVYPKGKTLNYAITARDVTLPAGTRLPVALTLDASLTLPVGTVLAADVKAADGSVLLAAGRVVGAGGLVVPAGATLGAGTRLPSALKVGMLAWPSGAPLPVDMTQTGSLALPVGALIASGTQVVLTLPEGVTSVPLRPTDASGRQGLNWSVARMLPEGSQSWSLRLVAGADLDAADARLRNTRGTGTLTLADTHYGVKVTPGGVKIGLNSNGALELFSNFGLPDGITNWQDMIGKSEDQIIRLYQVLGWGDFGLPMDYWDPTTGHILMGLTLQGANEVFNVAGLPPGMNSINELIGKTDLELVRLYGAFQWQDFGMPDNFWALGVGNASTLNGPTTIVAKAPAFSVVRTGTGDLSMAAGGDLTMKSAYGVYTAGTATSLGNAALDAKFNLPRGAINGGTVLGGAAESLAPAYERLVAGADSLYKAWYPDRGGNLSVDVGGNLTGDSWTASSETRAASSSVGNWLWRQGTGATAGVDAQPTAWWINFGSYVAPVSGVLGADTAWPTVNGFTGIGTLGGGDARIRVEGDAGAISRRTTGPVLQNSQSALTARGEGLVLAVASSGRVLGDGSLRQTGGGDLDVRVGGGWNSHIEARMEDNVSAQAQTHELYGALVNLRGAMSLSAGQIGTVEQFYGSGQDAKELRAPDPYASTLTRATGGLMLMPGDAGISIASRGDLVLGGTGDPGLAGTANFSAFTSSAGNGQRGSSWFSLWTDRTALRLMAAGGQLVLDTRGGESVARAEVADYDYGRNGGWLLLPGEVVAVAPVGSIYYGSSGANQLAGASMAQWTTAGLLQAPMGARRIELLAGQSLYGGGYAISSSGADASIMATPLHPGFAGFDASGNRIVTNGLDAYAAIDRGLQPLLMFGANTVSGDPATLSTGAEPSRFYAVAGDIVGLRSGTTVTLRGTLRDGQHDYVAAGPVSIKAGRDIVYAGNRLGDPLPTTFEFSGDPTQTATLSGNLVLNTGRNDVSVMQAGRDILYANVDVAGPGTLEINAGRNVIQNDKAVLRSIGPVVAADARPGAGIVVQTGLGAQGPDYGDFLKRYLDPANQAATGTPLADQPGKVVKTYRAELAAWLKARFDFNGGADEAAKFFAALPPEQQRIFARQVFFAELREGGREFNAVAGPRTGSYLRGRNAIASMFPVKDGGKSGGDLLMYGGSGIHTDLGGDIQVLTPGGAQTYGIEGAAPPATAGLITRGQGDIQLFSLGSILLGQSRVMTTFGGSILAWSAGGDINAGRGSKTTLVFTPPRRVYDEVGNVRLSPDVPSTGAGIATLNPLPEVKPGDIDLIAPLGTVDAGEAGIRVSGNINIAALHVVNAENIQVKGQSAGLPTVAAVNVGALASASQAAATAATAAQDVLQREREAVRQQKPSVFTVRVLGFGGDPAPTPPAQPASPLGQATVPYDPRSPVQVLGHGQALDPAVMAQLTETERKALLDERKRPAKP
jgi:filamentous hemagglutinin family protein